MIILSSMSTRLAQQLIDKNTGTEVWSELCLVYEERTSDATNSLKVPSTARITQESSAQNGDVIGHLYSVFRIRNELSEFGPPVSDLQLVNLMLRSLHQHMCYNELRRKVIFSFNMGNYTSELPREMIYTAAARDEDWERNGFGNIKVTRSKMWLDWKADP